MSEYAIYTRLATDIHRAVRSIFFPFLLFSLHSNRKIAECDDFFLSSRKNWKKKSQNLERRRAKTDATQFRVNCSQVSLSAYVKWFPLFPRRISYGQMCCFTISTAIAIAIATATVATAHCSSLLLLLLLYFSHSPSIRRPKFCTSSQINTRVFTKGGKNTENKGKLWLEEITQTDMYGRV